MAWLVYLINKETFEKEQFKISRHAKEIEKQALTHNFVCGFHLSLEESLMNE